jgi:hypothetical protein
MHNKKSNNNKSKNFIQGLRPFSSSITHGLKKIFKKNGYNFSNIVENWSSMVGNKISDACYPYKIKRSKNLNNNILLVNVIHGKELEIEYSKKEIMDKINSFFGYDCISEIILKIVRLEKENHTKKDQDFKIHKKFKKNLASIKNNKLKESLDNLIRAFDSKHD